MFIREQQNETWLTNSSWVFNNSIYSQSWLQSCYWDLKSVVTEELLYRGVLLYLLVQSTGNKKAVYVSAILSGTYRCFYHGRIGSIHNHGSYFPQHWFDGTGMGIYQKSRLMANIRLTFGQEHGSLHCVFQRAIGADAVAVRNWSGFNRLVVIAATVK